MTTESSVEAVQGAQPAASGYPTIEWAFRCNTLLGGVADGWRDTMLYGRHVRYTPDGNLCAGARWAAGEWLGRITNRHVRRTPTPGGDPGRRSRRARGHVEDGQLYVVPDEQLDDVVAFVASRLRATPGGEGIGEWSMALVREADRTRCAVALRGGGEPWSPLLDAFDVDYVVDFWGRGGPRTPEDPARHVARIYGADGSLLAALEGLIQIENERIPVRLARLAEAFGNGLGVLDRRFDEARSRPWHDAPRLTAPTRGARRLEPDERGTDHDLERWRKDRVARTRPPPRPMPARPGTRVAVELRIWPRGEDRDDPSAIIGHDRVLATAGGYKVEIGRRLRPKIRESVAACFADVAPLRQIDADTTVAITFDEADVGDPRDIGSLLECSGPGTPEVVIGGVRGHLQWTASYEPAVWTPDGSEAPVDDSGLGDDDVSFSVDFRATESDVIVGYTVTARRHGRLWEVDHPELDALDSFDAPTPAEGIAWAFADVFEGGLPDAVAVGLHAEEIPDRLVPAAYRKFRS